MLSFRHPCMVILIVALSLAGLRGVAPAQDEVFVDQARAKPLPPDQVHKINLQRAAKEAEMLRQRPQGPIRDVEVRPILNTRGEQLVGIIDQRTMTKTQLATRVNLILQHLPDIQNPNEKERAKQLLDRRVNLEGRILDEWERATVLAVTAEKQGFKASPQEVDQAIANLTAQNSVGATDQSLRNQIRVIGIAEAELRQEVSDGVIVEKMLRNQIDKVPDEGLMQVFNKSPQVFLEPVRVSAWELVATMLNRPTDDDIKQIKKIMSALSKRLTKCKTQAEYEALQKELAEDRDGMLKKLNGQTDADAIKQNMGRYKGIMLVNLDKVASTGYRLYREPVRPEVSKVLFEMKVGKVSDLIAAPAPPKKPTEFHILKVIERTAGHKGTFEEAKPQIKSLMMEKLKDVVCENILNMNTYDIRTDPAGLNDYIEKGRVATAAGAAPTPAPTPAPDAAAASTGAQRNPFQPARAARNIFDAPLPSVESVVGAKADQPAPGTTIAPAGEPPAPGALPGGAPPAQRAGTSVADLATSGTRTPAPEVAPAAPAPQPTPSTRRKKNQPPVNFNAPPPAVDDVLSRQNRARIR